MTDGAPQLTKKFIIPNELGLHARAATKLAQTSSRFTSSIAVESADKRRANGKSVLDLLTLGAEQGQTVIITVQGHDTDEALAAIEQLFGNNLGD